MGGKLSIICLKVEESLYTISQSLQTHYTIAVEWKSPHWLELLPTAYIAIPSSG